MRWIKTRHRMPPMDKEVLVWWIPAGSEEGNATISEHDEGGWMMGSAEGYRVTHWMLIQEPDAEEGTTDETD